jgi:hypothetical protein
MDPFFVALSAIGFEGAEKAGQFVAQEEQAGRVFLKEFSELRHGWVVGKIAAAGWRRRLR